MSVSFAPTKLRVPEGFEEMLYEFAKSALREQPADINSYGADYFKKLAESGPQGQYSYPYMM